MSQLLESIKVETKLKVIVLNSLRPCLPIRRKLMYDMPMTVVGHNIETDGRAHLGFKIESDVPKEHMFIEWADIIENVTIEDYTGTCIKITDAYISTGASENITFVEIKYEYWT